MPWRILWVPKTRSSRNPRRPYGLTDQTLGPVMAGPEPKSEPPKWRAETFRRLWRGGSGAVACSGSATSREAPLHAAISIDSPEGPEHRGLGSGERWIRTHGTF